jgi:hypothetical protein
MKRTLTTSFDELLKNRYGDSGRIDLSNTVKVEDLFASYYGKSAVQRNKKESAQPPVVVALSCDDGELIPQSCKGKRYDKDRAERSFSDSEFEEYVVERGALPMGSSLGPSGGTIPTSEVSAFQEYQVDVLHPLKDAIVPSAGPTPNASSFETPLSPGSEDKLPRQPVAAQPTPPVKEASRAQVTDDDFAADIQAILTGQNVLGPLSKKTIEKDKLGVPEAISNQNGLPAPESKNEHAIFDRIAESMQYATAYDLGTIELNNRFSDFDKISDIQEKAAAEKKSKNARLSSEQPSPAATVNSADFIQDLDTIRRGHSAANVPSETSPEISMSVGDRSESPNRDSACRTLALTLPFLSAPEYSRPLYDTGEHAQMGGDLYANRLRVGKSPGVPFSYGQLITMGDLYRSVEEMMAAEVSELTNLKTLIERDTQYYKTNKRNKKLSVDNKEWNDATGKRFLKLAEKNYEHFSPNLLFKDAIANAAHEHGNNKSTWEDHHKKAIEEAQKMFIAPENQNRSFFPEWPLIINAFGDHFLTDAFASGHLINKEVTIAYFKANFYKDGSLKPAAEKFFERVAQLAFGQWWQMTKVRRKFSALETTDYPVCAWGWCLKWRPNIDTEDMFRKLLVEAATQEPDKIGNFAVKALHDRLNKDGIEVFNNAGDKPWTLTGDDFLNPTSLGIIRKAVQQSVDNINDPSINATNLNFGTYFAKVWKYVPQLTEASQKKLVSLTHEYTNPDSVVLSTAAATIITEQVDELIDVLVNEEKKLKPA